MNADSFISDFIYSGPDGYATDEDIRRIFETLEKFPNSSRLWNFCGDAIQLSNAVDYTLHDAKRCYESAIEVSPADPLAYEALGFWYDIQNDLDASVHYFQLAVERSDSDTPRIGLARAFAQLGKVALAKMQMSLCIHQNSFELAALREEIANGVWLPR